MKKQGYYCRFVLRRKSRRYKRKWLKHNINLARRANAKMKNWVFRSWIETNNILISEMTIELNNL